MDERKTAATPGRERDSRSTGLAVRVIVVQIIALLLLWLMQSRYGAG